VKIQQTKLKPWLSMLTKKPSKTIIKNARVSCYRLECIITFTKTSITSNT